MSLLPAQCPECGLHGMLHTTTCESFEARMMRASKADNERLKFIDAENTRFQLLTIEQAEKLDQVKEDNAELFAAIKQLRAAIEPFAESPISPLDTAPCHNGITTREKCRRCNRGLAAWKAWDETKEYDT